MRTLTHFIAGEHVAGTSGAFGDVFDPNTGEVQARVPLAGRGEVEAAIADAAAAQPAWAAFNPQKRARVLMKFLELIARETNSLARLLSSEHGKTIPDARGDIQRGVEVIEFACGIPHLLKGEFSDSAGTGIDVYSMRQPLGVVAAITPFNFPAMIPLWKIGPALACGNAVILKPSERNPSVPLRIAELFIEAGLPPGVLNVVNGGKDAVDTSTQRPRRTASARSVSVARKTTPSSCRMPISTRRSMRWWAPPMARPASGAWRFRWPCRWASAPPMRWLKS
jgi:malonate-semialdehyde dehydrogenase (acetylating)/methylmalonate-semialdehyde dehydrogenase